MSTPSFTIRQLSSHAELPLWLDLLAAAFKEKGTPRCYFRDHYESDPMSSPEDIFVVVVDDYVDMSTDALDITSPRPQLCSDGKPSKESTTIKCPKSSVKMTGTMVSSVRIFRRAVVVNGVTLRMGGIGEVATHPKYQGRGFVRKLLERAVEYMIEQGCTLSMLHSVRFAEMYTKLGWEMVPTLHCRRYDWGTSWRDRNTATKATPAVVAAPPLAAGLAVSAGRLLLTGSTDEVTAVELEAMSRLLADSAWKTFDGACVRGSVGWGGASNRNRPNGNGGGRAGSYWRQWVMKEASKGGMTTPTVLSFLEYDASSPQSNVANSETEDDECRMSSYMIVRAHPCEASDDASDGNNWHWIEVLEAAAVNVPSPSLLSLLHHSITYLLDSQIISRVAYVEHPACLPLMGIDALMTGSGTDSSEGGAATSSTNQPPMIELCERMNGFMWRILRPSDLIDKCVIGVPSDDTPTSESDGQRESSVRQPITAQQLFCNSPRRGHWWWRLDAF